MSEEPTWIEAVPDHLVDDIYSELGLLLGVDGNDDEASDWLTDIVSTITPYVGRVLERMGTWFEDDTPGSECNHGENRGCTKVRHPKAWPLYRIIEESEELVRNAADEIDHLRAVVAQAVEELGDHRQDPATEGMKRGMCVLCGAADGQWPCVTAMVRADLARLLTEEQT